MKNYLSFFLFSLLLFSASLHASPYSIKRVSGISISETSAIQKFYGENQDKFLWIDGNKLSFDTKEIITDIGASWVHGLNPANYRYTILQELAKNGVPKGREIETEVLLSDSIILYAQDLSGMRISPKELDEDGRSWSRGVDAYSLLNILAERNSRADFVQLLLPNDMTYQRLSDELQNIVQDLAKNPENKIKKIKFSGTLKPAMIHPSIIPIRQKMGDNSQSQIYDEDLRKKIIEFQKSHGLAADGLIGPRSFDAIFQTRTQKLIKLVANLERRRWVRRPLPSKYIEVNIPQMQLYAVNNTKVSFQMPVIVGRDKRPTNSFIDEIIGIRFNPLWYVPDTIKKEDFLPALQKDPNALVKKGILFRVKTEEGMKKVSSSEIDWANMSEDGLKSVQMYQDSGEENALGVIRVLMPNKYDIYLHDTNAPELFVKDDRALSSGCVRLSEPRRIANFILGDNHEWSDEKLEKIIAKQKLVEVSAEYPIPVYLFYFTAWVDPKGKVIIANDLYGWDGKLVQALQQKGKIPFEFGKIQ